MSITVFTGLPGSGKSSRLIELVNAARQHGRPVLTFASSESPWLMARDTIRENRLLSSRTPGLVCPLDHLVTTRECAAVVTNAPLGALLAFDEAHAFSTAIAQVWLDASERGLDVVVAMPSMRQLNYLNGNDYHHTVLKVECQKCRQTEASTFVVVPGEDATLALCLSCQSEMTESARREVLRRLEEQEPYAGERVLYQPVELDDCADWKVLRPDTQTRAEAMARMLREANLLPGEHDPQPSYLDVACNTGFFCHYFRQLGFYAEGVDVVEGDITVCRLLDSFLRKDNNLYVASDAVDYLRSTRDRRFDVTSAFSVFPWIAMQSSVERAVECTELLFAKTRKVCFIEIGYTTEAHYQGKLPVEIDREWVLDLLKTKGRFAEIRILDAEANHLMRDLFVGIKAPGG